jgi:hypothetical protein
MSDYGTRATGTDSFVYRILQTPEYRTIPIISRFLEAAMIAPPADNVAERARNIVARMEKYEDTAIPRDTFDLVCWSDLALTAGKQTKAESAYKPKPRKYVVCLGCERRFLAKRANNLTCSPRCQRRAHRKVAVSDFVKMTLPEAA